MFVDARDVRPASALHHEPADKAQLVGGALTATLVPAAVAIAAAVATAVSALIGTPHKPPIDEVHVVEASFVRLGKPPDPHKLPNRKVPIKATAPDDKVVVSDNPQEHPKVDAGVRPPNAVTDDLLRNVLGSANKYAEIAQEREREGSPDGLADGTSDKASSGSMLSHFLKTGWTEPNTIPPDELAKLVATVKVRFGRDLTITDYQILKSSGNPVFDQGVLEQLHRLQQSHAVLPDSPTDPASRYVGNAVKAFFNGSDAQ